MHISQVTQKESIYLYNEILVSGSNYIKKSKIRTGTLLLLIVSLFPSDRFKEYRRQIIQFKQNINE